MSSHENHNSHSPFFFILSSNSRERSKAMGIHSNVNSMAKNKIKVGAWNCPQGRSACLYFCMWMFMFVTY